MELVPSKSLSAFEQLPPELIVDIFEFTNLVTRIQRAWLSKSIRKAVHDGKKLWTVLNFDEDERCRKNLTDEALKALLTRINAREVTTKIFLRGCIKIQGTGLEPLYVSKISPTVLIDCHQCKKTRFEDPEFDEIDLCDGCNHLFCRECHDYDRECHSCGELFCDECNPVDKCWGCHETMCSRCNDNNWESLMCSHSQCDRVCCDSCVDRLEYSIKKCTLCHREFCNTCREVKYVDCCSLDVCTGCKNTACLLRSVQAALYCEGCVSIQQCDSCDKAACESCCYQCVSCGEAACESCCYLGVCIECNEKPPKKAKRDSEGSYS